MDGDVDHHPAAPRRLAPPVAKPPARDVGGGDLRKLLVVGATSVVRRARTGRFATASWLRALLERRPARVVTIAMVNKTARIVWAALARQEAYRPA